MHRPSIRGFALALLSLAVAQPFFAGMAHSAQAQSRLPRELHKVSVGDATAHFGGVREKGDRDAPLEYSVTRLWFTFRGDRNRYEFRPKGELFFSDWRFDIFSPDGRHVLLLQDRFGPYHVVAEDKLRAYLRGKSEPDQVLSGAAADGSAIAGVHHEARWASNDSIEFKFTCCGQTLTKKVFLRSPPR